MHRRCPGTSGWRDGPAPRLHREGRLDRRHVPAQLPRGHVRHLDRVGRELLARAWAAGAGPDTDPLTIDLDSTICETYGLKKEGALHHGYTHVRGFHPLLAIAAGTSDVLHARLREGRANTARCAANFPRETISGTYSLAHAIESRDAGDSLLLAAGDDFALQHGAVAVLSALRPEK